MQISDLTTKIRKYSVQTLECVQRLLMSVSKKYCEIRFGVSVNCAKFRYYYSEQSVQILMIMFKSHYSHSPRL